MSRQLRYLSIDALRTRCYLWLVLIGYADIIRVKLQNLLVRVLSNTNLYQGLREYFEVSAFLAAAA